jgi:hypothetical protein
MVNFNPVSGNQVGDPSKFMRRPEIVYNSYAGTDIVAQIILPNETPLILGELQTISVSTHRENRPVRAVGHVSPIGFGKGPRTIAGSLIFTQFNQYAFYRIGRYQELLQQSGNQIYPLADMLPPFDVVLSFSNEFGSFSKMNIYGVTVVDEGSTMSIDDLITEQTYTYMARGIQPLTNYIPDGVQEFRGLGTSTTNTLRLG